MNGGDFDPRADQRSSNSASYEMTSCSADLEHAGHLGIGPEVMLELLDRNDRPGRSPPHEDLGPVDDPTAAEHISPPIFDPALIASAVLIGRALSKKPDLYARIMVDAPVLILECQSGSWIEPTIEALRRCFGSPPERMRRKKPGEPLSERRGAIVVSARAGRADTRSGDDVQAGRAFRCFLPLFGVVAPGTTRLPEELECACDARIVLGAVEPPDLTLVVRRITGASPSTTISASIAELIEPMDLRIALHPSRGPEGAMDRLRCIVERRGL